MKDYKNIKFFKETLEFIIGNKLENTPVKVTYEVIEDKEVSNLFIEIPDLDYEYSIDMTFDDLNPVSLDTNKDTINLHKIKDHVLSDIKK